MTQSSRFTFPQKINEDYATSIPENSGHYFFCWWNGFCLLESGFSGRNLLFELDIRLIVINRSFVNCCETAQKFFRIIFGQLQIFLTNVHTFTLLIVYEQSRLNNNNRLTDKRMNLDNTWYVITQEMPETLKMIVTLLYGCNPRLCVYLDLSNNSHASISVFLCILYHVLLRLIRLTDNSWHISFHVQYYLNLFISISFVTVYQSIMSVYVYPNSLVLYKLQSEFRYFRKNPNLNGLRVSRTVQIARKDYYMKDCYGFHLNWKLSFVCLAKVDVIIVS